jgi:hypothetical protein
MKLLVVLQLTVLLALANGAPVFAKKIFGDRFAQPLDGGIGFLDGRPLFGRSKTIRGILLSLAVTTLGALLIGLAPEIGALVAGGAMAGDLCSSFLKRRLHLQPSSQAIGIDQIPESLLPLIICRSLLSLTAAEIVVAVAIFFIGELLLSRLLYSVHLRDQPY